MIGVLLRQSWETSYEQRTENISALSYTGVGASLLKMKVANMAAERSNKACRVRWSRSYQCKLPVYTDINGYQHSINGYQHSNTFK